MLAPTDCWPVGVFTYVGLGFRGGEADLLALEASKLSFRVQRLEI